MLLCAKGRLLDLIKLKCNCCVYWIRHSIILCVLLLLRQGEVPIGIISKLESKIRITLKIVISHNRLTHAGKTSSFEDHYKSLRGPRLFKSGPDLVP